MSAALVVPFGPTVYLVRSGAAPASFPGPTGRPAARPARGLPAGPTSEPLLRALRDLPASTEIRSAPPALAKSIADRLGRAVLPATLDEWRAALASLPLSAVAAERAFLRGIASADLEAALRAPDEVLVTLAREEERLERAVGREARAAEAMIPVPADRVLEYATRWAATRSTLERHHRALVESVEAAAREVVPNLAAVVGPRVAARLVAAAGGTAPLARMRAGRLQLLGSRRRPSPERGPRFGVIFRAERMADVPVGRRAAYARSLGALAAIAVRADATTRAAIAPTLVARRDRRIERLRRGSP